MRKTIYVVVAAMWMLGAGAADAHKKGGKWQTCPKPACEAPCSETAPKDVDCKTPDGKVSDTSFACCCCGGGAGVNKFKKEADEKKEKEEKAPK